MRNVPEKNSTEYNLKNWLEDVPVFIAFTVLAIIVFAMPLI